MNKRCTWNLARLSAAAISLVLVLGVFAPSEALAQCAATADSGTGKVLFQSCTEVSSSGQTTSLNVPYPSTINSGDVLIMATTVRNNVGFLIPAGWVRVMEEVRTGVTLAVFRRIANGTESGNQLVQWTGPYNAQAIMMRFTGATGRFEEAWNNTNASATTAIAPSITPYYSNYLALRIAAMPGDAFGTTPSGDLIADGTHSEIDRETAPNAGTSPTTSVSLGAAYKNFTTGGASSTATVNLAQESVALTATIALEFGAAGTPTGGTPGPTCPRGADSALDGTQSVLFMGCKATSLATQSTATTIGLNTPDSVAAGDVLLALLSIGSDEEPTAPSGWTRIFFSNHLATVGTRYGASYASYRRVVTTSEPATHTFSLSNVKGAVGTISAFRNANPNITASTTIATGESLLTPDVTTVAPNSLVVRTIAADDQDITSNPAEIIPYYRNLLTRSSNRVDFGVNIQAAYANIASAGAVPSERMYNRQDEESTLATFLIGPEVDYQLRFSMADSSSQVCGIQQVTLTITDQFGNTVTDFAGEVSLSVTTSTAANRSGAEWVDIDSSLNGTLLTGSNGAATYTFDSADNGVAIFDFHNPNATTVNFNASYYDSVRDQTYTESSSYDPDLSITADCKFRIEHDGEAGTCGMESITVTLVDLAGVRAYAYTGTMLLENSLSSGNYSVITGSGTLNPSPDSDNNGSVSYTFAAGDSARVVLGYSQLTAGTVNFDATDSTSGYSTTTTSTSLYDADLTVRACEIRIDVVDSSNAGDMCSVEQITFTIATSAGTTITNFNGTITLGTDSGNGDWQGGETNTVNNGTANDGAASYTFATADGGDVTLGFTHLYVVSNLGFTATGTATNGATLIQSTTVDEEVTIAACTVDIQVADGLASTCGIGEVVTYTIKDSAGNVATNFAGYLVLDADTGKGDYEAISANGTFENQIADDGAALYVFNSSDSGVLTVRYKNTNAGTVNLTAEAPGITLNSGSDRDIVFSGCEFRIAYVDSTPATGDVCTQEVVRIGIYDSLGSVVTDYTGTINVSASTGLGDWSISDADSTIVDPVSDDGNFTYTFVSTDLGQADFAFDASATGTVNFDVSDGVTTDPRNSADSDDRSLSVNNCNFQISYSGGANHTASAFSACSVQAVTIEIYDSLGNRKTDYTGLVSISTTNDRGTWSVSDADGTLTSGAADSGTATYQFVTSDAGIITLNYSSTLLGSLNIDIVEGTISVDSDADPLLTVTGCTPSVGTPSCSSPPSKSASLAISAQNSDSNLRGRLVVMVIAYSATTPVSSATFNGASMTRIHRAQKTSTVPATLDMWGILDSNLPTSAGTYTGEYVGGSNGPAMCLMFLDNVAQAFPSYNATTPTSGAVNGSIGTTNVASTTITTPAAKSIIVSGVVGGQSGGTQTDYGTISPSALTRAFQGPDPTASDFAGSSGIIDDAESVTVTETRNGLDSNRHAHVAAAFAPLNNIVSSGPSDYVPLSLRATYSGALGFKAIGNTLRQADGGDASCVMRTDAVPATLDLPGAGTPSAPNSSIVAAWLYWFGSGNFAAQPSGADFDTVTLIAPDSTSTSIDADGIHNALRVFGSTNKYYYVAYKDVTSLVDEEGVYKVDGIDSDTSSTYLGDRQCAAGWSMLVVYKNDKEQFRVVNVYDGIHPVDGSVSTDIAQVDMDNFVMSSTNVVGNLPNGQLGFVVMEGDVSNYTGKESYLLQAAPTSSNFNVFTNYYNQPYAAHNATVSRPILSLQSLGTGTSLYYSIDTTSGRLGYEVDFEGSYTGLTPSASDETGDSYGLDIDTFHLSPAGTELGYLFDGFTLATTKGLAAFGNVNATTLRSGSSAGSDKSLLVAQALSITNEAVADLEITLSERAPFEIGSTGIYDIAVTMNPNEGINFGNATGVVTVTGRLPSGLSFANTSAVSGTGWTCTVTTSPSAYTCNFNIATSWTTALGAQTNGQLGESSTSGVGETLPTLSAQVTIADSSVFTSATNSVRTVARLLHSDGTCTATTTGVSPDPAGCEPPQFDNVNYLDGGTIDLNDLTSKTALNNNVHSLNTSITSPRVDLQMQKLLASSLDKDTNSGAYTLRVKNVSSSTSSSQFVVRDVQPAGVGFSSASGTGFTCAISSGVLTCTRNSGLSLTAGQSVDITVSVTVSGEIDDVVYNTATVTVGSGEVDTDLSNNSATLASTIIGSVPASQDKFLISVDTLSSSVRGSTTLGDLASFEDDDLVLYNPLTNSATLFFDDSASNTSQIDVNDINAIHLLPNGHLVMSASVSGTATGVGSFGAEDIVKYYPIAKTSSLLFDGSAIFADSGEIIDAVYVLDDGDIVFSTAGDASIGSTSWTRSDLVRYDVSAGTASIYFAGSDSEFFGSGNTNQVAGLYLRVSSSDATVVSDRFDFTASDEFSRVAVGGSPALGTITTKDDIGEIDRQTGSDTTYTSKNVFVGSSNPGVFDSVGSPDRDAERYIDALHIVEEGYIGHFSITQSAAGSVCEVGKIRITKHLGTSHSADTDYYGTIQISTSTGTGNWGLVSGSGTLDNGTSGDGQATYTFVASDNGVVELSLGITTVTTGLNVNVTNGVASESSTEDPSFDFNTVVTSIQYLDQFTVASFSNNNGSFPFKAPWVEEDDDDGKSGDNSGAGVAVGNVTVSSGVLTLQSSKRASRGRPPSVARSIALDAYTVTDAINLNFDYSYDSVSASDQIVVEATDDGTNWTTLQTYTGLTGSASGLSATTTRLDTFGGSLDDFTGTLTVRFKVDSGYTSGGSFSIDNVEITTATTDCNVVAMDHYAISHDGSGIACLGSTVTIIGHDSSHNPVVVPAGEIMTLSNNRLKGTWASIVTGGGTLTDVGAAGAATNTDGQGTYAWSGTEDSVSLRFNYTSPATDPESVNFELSGSYFEDEVTAAHDTDLSISKAGLRFYDVTHASEGIPTQIAGKNSSVGFGAATIHLQAIKSSDEDPTACAALFPDNQVVEIEFAAECKNPNECSTSANPQYFQVNGERLGAAMLDDNGVAGADSYTGIDVTFTVAGGVSAAPIVLSYLDAGQMQLHARYNIPFDSNPSGILSGDYMEGSATFVSRPFGFIIDFANDRISGTNATRADSASGTKYLNAGVAFATTLDARSWEAVDDLDNDGVPDIDSDLSNNRRTANYGNEIGSAENDVIVTHALDLPAAARGSREGVLSGGNTFTNFVRGVATADLSYDEVGIIDLTARLADNNYLGSGQDVQGNVQNVGRFTPNHFTLTLPSVTAMCTAATDFTYMGEPFPVSFVLEARNLAGAITQNYIGDFVKLAASRFAPDTVFHAVQDRDSAADVDYSSRAQSIDSSFSVSFDDFGESNPGVGTVMGRVVFNRENDGLLVDGAPDGPFTLRIGTSITDSDGTAIQLGTSDIDVDDGTTEPGTSVYANLTTTPILFRYGRLIIDNAFGPETEALEIPIRVEYYDGSEFRLNRDDSCTTLTFNVTTPPLTIVAGSVKAPSGTANPLSSGDTEIEKGVTANFTVTLSNGRTGDTNIVSSGSDPDRPFSASAPSGGQVGSAIVELDLGYTSSTDPVDFLRYDWRGGSTSSDPYLQEVPDASHYTNNPRAIIEFGSYRAHDRILSWRELYVMP